jgi:hypothetical protein
MPESRNRPLLGNGSAITFRSNGHAGKGQSTATGLTSVSWQRIKQGKTDIGRGSRSRKENQELIFY